MNGTTGAAHQAAREIDRVLDALQGHNMFRKNAFRVTGLAPDATARQVRRAREESRNKYYVPPEGPAEGPGALLPPSSDPVELRAAFEVLQDPVARLVHELLWAGAAEQGDRAGAVRTLCRALEGTSERGTVLTDTAWGNWRNGLGSWADALRSEATWKQARRRVAEIDDPRVTVALLRTLRQRLQAHVVGVAAELAAREARTSPGTAGRLVRAVRGAGFDSGDVLRALRSAAQPELDRVGKACDVARSTDKARVGLESARTLLAVATERLPALLALLGAEDDLLQGSKDDVALTANNCVVAYANEHAAALGGEPSGFRDVLGLLARARVFASTPGTTELVDKNFAAFTRIQGTIERLREATEAVRRSGAPPARAPGGARSVSRPRPASRPGPTSRSGPMRTPRSVSRLGPNGVERPPILSMWGWLLVLGPVPAVGIGLGAAALGLPWLWFVGPALIVAFYVAYLREWNWTYVKLNSHARLLLLPAIVMSLVTAWLGGPIQWLTLAALTLSIVIATAKET